MLLTECIEVLDFNIKKALRHQDYKRVNELQQKYLKLITGEGINSLLSQFVKRETKEMFDQRVLLTQAITPAVANSLINPFAKVTKNKKVTKRLEYQNERVVTGVQGMADTFYGDDKDGGLDYFLQSRFVELSFCDPNAFIVVEWGQFDNRYEYPKPYPFEVSSENAINFHYVNNVLKWLITRDAIKYNDAGTLRNGYKYTIYSENFSATFTQVSEAYRVQAGEIKTTVENRGTYLVQTFEHKMGFVPAVRVGYKRDIFTNGRTFVNPLHSAMTYFMKSLKTVSELDLTTSLHVFPQKLQYVTPCPGTVKNPCIRGCDKNGSICSECKGAGVKIHTSAQDAILFPLPKTKEEMLPLNDMLVYKAPDIELVKFMAEYTDSLEVKAHRAIFNSDIFVNPANKVVQTATEQDNNMDSIYDTLSPFASILSKVYVFFTKSFLVLAGGSPEAAVIKHSYPADLKMETMGTLLSRQKLVSESSAPSFIKDAVANDIAEIIYVDDEIGMKRYKVKQVFYPFSGKTVDEINTLINSEYVAEFDKVLYANFEQIFAEIEREAGVDFWYWAYTKQWDEVKKKVDNRMADIKTNGMDRLTTAIKTNIPGNASGAGSGAGDVIPGEGGQA